LLHEYWLLVSLKPQDEIIVRDLLLIVQRSMGSEKKCPHCGSWTVWEKKPTDRCTNCNELLDSVALQEMEIREESDRVFKENDFFRVRQDDNFLMVAIRKTGWVLHAIFAAIAWGVLWFVTTFAG
jgi:hypothetical protein